MAYAAALRTRNAAANVFGIEPIVLSHEIDTGIKITMQNPAEAGADRIANAAGAHILYQQGFGADIFPRRTCTAPRVAPEGPPRQHICAKPVIVVDFGTATSFDVVNQNGEFIGGAIAPGLNLQLNTLSKYTSKLPWIDAAISHTAVGNNTADAILSGVIRGSAAMIDNLTCQMEKELGSQAIIVATGGYCGLVASYMNRKFDFVNPTLTLEGLRHLYNLNVGILTKTAHHVRGDR